MSLRKPENVEKLYLQRVGFIGSILLIGITLMNYFVDTGTFDYPIPRILIAISIFTIAVLSKSNSWIQRNGLKLLYIHFFVYNFYGIALVALNHFQPIDTSSTILIGFALCAFIKNKQVLNVYLAFLLVTYLVFYLTAEEVVINREYFFLVLTFILTMGYMVFNGKLEADQRIEESKKQLENSEKRFRGIFEKAPVGIMLSDLRLNPIRVNHVLETMTGYKNRYFVTHNPQEYVHEDDYIGTNDLLAKVMDSENKKHVLEQRWSTKSGETLWVRMTMALLKMELRNEYYIVSMIEDITFQMKAKQQLEEYAEKLEMHNKALEEFSYVISHDLQEPLRMIRSYTGLIKRRYIKQIDDKNASIDMDFVIDGADRMSNLIRDMLEYTRWTAKQYEKEIVDTREVLVNVIKNLTISISEKGGAIECYEMPQVQTNKLLFGQVLQNLIGNGLKYTCEDRKPNIIIKAEDRKADYLFSISDNGQGFCEDEKERIFGIFQRLHGRNSHYKGTGIGLAICKRIIEKQGGRIWAEGVKNKGATFYFTIPKEQFN